MRPTLGCVPSVPSPAPVPGQVTQLLLEWRSGDDSSFERLLHVVYPELRAIAQRQLRGEAEGHTLQPTALVHEAYLRLVGSEIEWEDRRHFFAVAARAMRHVLVDHARARRRDKRGGDALFVTLDDQLAIAADSGVDLLALDEALDRLAVLDERKARAVELHFFAGLSYDETARALDVSPATVDRDLRMAKAWLLQQLK
jgi:RNA polymerase sigma factor (TIGR02999 family)